MVRRTTTTPPPQAPAKLVIPTAEAREKLLARRDAGEQLSGASTRIASEAQLEIERAAFRKWSDYNFELLRRMFDTEEYAKGYQNAGTSGFVAISMYPQPFHETVSEHYERVHAKVIYLDNLAERIDLISVSPSAPLPSPSLPQNERVTREPSNSKVFIVHGQDNETKAVVARFIEQLGLDAIVLHEQTDQGRTIIEKFEAHSDVGYAVVLLTPDDVGGLAPGDGSDAALRPRARQNVILELGYFVGRLGRTRVCALRKGDTEMPSDFAGVVYTPYDGADEGWKLKLARELKTAGLHVDLNKALG